MNIFVLSLDPEECAKMHVDRHVVKMIVEYAQIMSTVHRYLDGSPTSVSSGGKSKIVYLLDGETCTVTDSKFTINNSRCYKMTHKNHPCVLWAMKSSENYKWLYSLFCELVKEYEYRYGKKHATWTLLGDWLKQIPSHIPEGPLTEFALAMPDEYKTDNAVSSYRRYIIGAKSHFAKWSKRAEPVWVL